MSEDLSHVRPDGQPGMVNIGSKEPTHRTAVAEAQVRIPASVADCLEQGDLHTPKGPVFQTAIIAGTLGAKQTHQLIPFCHPLPIDGCDIDIVLEGECIRIRCTVQVFHKTGVEMEALTGATVAALAVYDMCKSLSHDLCIEETRLVSKTGGKSDVGA
jgi:cyclic pyranopterin phosphate synthase